MALGLKLISTHISSQWVRNILTPTHNPRSPKPDEVSLHQHLEHSIPWTVAEKESA